MSPLPKRADPAVYRFSEQCFRRYEPILVKLLHDYPQPVTFAPEGLKTTTVAARLSDAIVSGLVNRWPSELDYHRLATIRQACSITYNSTHVTIGPRQLGKTIADNVVLNIQSNNEFRVTVDALEVLEALLTLASYNVLTDKRLIVNVTDNRLLDKLRDETFMFGYPNVVIEPIDSQTFLLL